MYNYKMIKKILKIQLIVGLVLIGLYAGSFWSIETDQKKQEDRIQNQASAPEGKNYMSYCSGGTSETLIEANDKQCYMDAKATNGTDISRAVSAVDHLVIDGETWRVMNVKEYNPSGSYTIMYDLMLRKGL